MYETKMIAPSEWFLTKLVSVYFSVILKTNLSKTNEQTTDSKQTNKHIKNIGIKKPAENKQMNKQTIKKH